MARKGKQGASPRPRSKFPTTGALLDASMLCRFHKCQALERFRHTLAFAVSGHVHGEFAAGGPSARAALTQLQVTRRPIIAGSPEWSHLVRIRGGFSTVDLGEDESIAIALAEADRGVVIPFVTYDDGATKKAHSLDVATVSFLETLAWLVTCGVLTEKESDEIEQRAVARDGWKRPVGQADPLASLLGTLTEALTPRIMAATRRARVKRPTRRG